MVTNMTYVPALPILTNASVCCRMKSMIYINKTLHLCMLNRHICHVDSKSVPLEGGWKAHPSWQVARHHRNPGDIGKQKNG